MTQELTRHEIYPFAIGMVAALGIMSLTADGLSRTFSCFESPMVSLRSLLLHRLRQSGRRIKEGQPTLRQVSDW